MRAALPARIAGGPLECHERHEPNRVITDRRALHDDASLSSSPPDHLQRPGKSREDELGVRRQANGWQVGMAAFAISKPYRFEQQTVSVRRSSQEHRGYEATLGSDAIPAANTSVTTTRCRPKPCTQRRA